jgi:hypothetical protein
MADAEVKLRQETGCEDSKGNNISREQDDATNIKSLTTEDDCSAPIYDLLASLSDFPVY